MRRLGIDDGEERVAFGPANKCEGDAQIARSRLDHDRALAQEAMPFQVLHQGVAGSIFRRARRVGSFELEMQLSEPASNHKINRFCRRVAYLSHKSAHLDRG